jgi:flagellar biosynthesis anti-sigma factor FlgM
MTQKIDSLAPPPGTAVTGSRAPVAPRSDSGGSGEVRGVPAADSVALTPDAQTLQRMEQVIAGLPVTDAGRVEQIRAQLRDGTYTINPGVVADQLARMEWELGIR